MTEWQIQGSRVFSNGEGKSYNCTNRVTANELYQTLTQYENIIKITKETENKLDKVTKGIIQIQRDLRILQEDINKLKGGLKK